MTSATTTPTRPPLARLLAPPQELQLPPDQLPIPPKPVPDPGHDMPDEVNPERPPEIGDPTLPGEHVPVRDPQPPATVHARG